MLKLLILLLFPALVLAGPCGELFSKSEATLKLENTEFAYLLKGDARERLSRSNASAQALWGKYSADAVYAINKNISNHLSDYLEAKRLNHPHIKALEELGYSFSPEVFVPDLAHVFSVLEQRVMSRLNQGGSFDSIVVPQVGLIDKTISGEIVAVPFGYEKTDVLELLPRSKTAFSESLSRDFTNRRLLVFGSSELINRGRDGDVSVLEHDLSHYLAFYEPRGNLGVEYARAVEEGNRHQIQFFNDLDYHSLEYADTPSKRRQNRSRWRQIFYAYETLFAIVPPKRESLGEYLNLPSKSSLKDLSLNDFYTHLEALNPEQLLGLAKKLYEGVWEYIVPLGGAERDIISFKAFNRSPEQFPLSHRIAALRGLQTYHAKEVMIKAIADYQYMIVLLSLTNVTDMVLTAYGKTNDPAALNFFRHTMPNFGL